jgi:hypothetical protein
MSSNVETLKVKVVDLIKSWKFVFDNFLTWSCLELQGSNLHSVWYNMRGMKTRDCNAMVREGTHEGEVAGSNDVNHVAAWLYVKNFPIYFEYFLDEASSILYWLYISKSDS